MAPRDTQIFLARYLETNLDETLLNRAERGSDFASIRRRILASGLRDNPLLIWDGSCNGHKIGSIEAEMASIDAIVRFKQGRANWLLIPSLVLSTEDDAAAKRADMVALQQAVTTTYGIRHVFDAFPVISRLANGSRRDREDVAGGFGPRSLLVDGLHLNERALMAVANALTARGGPMEAVRTL